MTAIDRVSLLGVLVPLSLVAHKIDRYYHYLLVTVTHAARMIV